MYRNVGTTQANNYSQCTQANIVINASNIYHFIFYVHNRLLLPLESRGSGAANSFAFAAFS